MLNAAEWKFHKYQKIRARKVKTFILTQVPRVFDKSESDFLPST